MPAFRADPVYAWFLHTFDSSERDVMREKLFRGFFIQCALNNGVFIEAGDFSSCGVFMPPGESAENPWTFLKAGLLPALWNIGFGTFKVLSPSFPSCFGHMTNRCLLHSVPASSTPLLLSISKRRCFRKKSKKITGTYLLWAQQWTFNEEASAVH